MAIMSGDGCRDGIAIKPFAMNERASGILLHITSLPSPYGIGDFGPEAYRFADFLSEACQRFWQILPLNPVSTVFGNSPYSSYSAFAGNHLLISPDLLVHEGLLSVSDFQGQNSPVNQVDYTAVSEFKEKMLHKAYGNFNKNEEDRALFLDFCRDNDESWLEDYALFISLKERFKGVVWTQWPVDIKHRDGDAVRRWKEELRERILFEKFVQYIFFKQLSGLKTYCHHKGIQIIGDLPIYVIHDSAEVWSNPELFKLNENMEPLFVAGVPPDYFSRTGQLWGNPVYRWDKHRENGYEWWMKRVRHNLNHYDVLRFDHFRGFVAYWEIRAGSETAIDGRWVAAPAEDFFSILLRTFPDIPVIAEDLGIITPDVEEIRDSFEFPGMKLLLFAFGDDLPLNPYIPHNYSRNCVAYTGTHDNNTIRGWFEEEAAPEERERLMKYVGKRLSGDSVHRELIMIAMMSVANLVIIPMQDMLGLGNKARMNLPSTLSGNWEWRLLNNQITPRLINYLSGMTWIYNRCRSEKYH